ncbi:MAG TPA: S41 family peptidase [Myxococcales bacterium]|nr:S41 family peptidase [Myxococcales bacterium]
MLALSMLAAGCEAALVGSDPPNTPVSNFDLLWTDFDRYYALFEEKGIDWSALRDTYRPLAAQAADDRELWNVVTPMLAQLNDVHVLLCDSGDSRYFNSGPLEGLRREGFSLDLVKNVYLRGAYSTSGDFILYGRVPDTRLGYLYVASFAGDKRWADGIDDVIRALGDRDAIIVDIRDNGGGSTHNYQTIASAFVDRPITYLWWRARNGPGHGDFEPPAPLTVTPRPLHFTRRIALLTNRFSASSSDHFALIFKNLSYSTQIGDTTAGGFGSVTMMAELPNGWTYHFSGRYSTTPDGVIYEGVGVEPDLAVHNTAADVAAGRDPAFEAAVACLTGAGPCS